MEVGSQARTQNYSTGASAAPQTTTAAPANNDPTESLMNPTEMYLPRGVGPNPYMGECIRKHGPSVEAFKSMDLSQQNMTMQAMEMCAERKREEAYVPNPALMEKLNALIGS